MRAGGAFARARAMLSMIAAAMAAPNTQQALAAIGPYRSRGHGQGLLGNKHSRHTVAMDKRAARKARNKRRG